MVKKKNQNMSRVDDLKSQGRKQIYITHFKAQEYFFTKKSKDIDLNLPAFGLQSLEKKVLLIQTGGCDSFRMASEAMIPPSPLIS